MKSASGLWESGCRNVSLSSEVENAVLLLSALLPDLMLHNEDSDLY